MNVLKGHLVVAAAIAFGLAACAHDRSADVRSAENELNQDEMNARKNQAELDQKQANEQAAAQQKAMSPSERAELESKQRQERAEQRSDDQQNISSSENKVVEKTGNLEQDRRDFETKSRERLTKADAKAKEYKAKSAKLPAGKKSDFNNNWTKYTSQKSESEKSVSGLAKVSNDTWSSNKPVVESSLDALEETVDKLGKDL